MRVLTPPVYLLAAMVAGILLGYGLFWGVLLLVLLLWVRSWSLWLLAACSLGWGWGHSVQLQKVVHPLVPYYGQKWEIEGHWDGRFLNVPEPKVRLALAPAPQVPPGQLVVRGTLDRPEGRRNFDAFDYAAWLELRGVQGVLYGGKVVQSRPDQGFKTHFQRGLTTGLSEQHAALMVALELGDKQDLKGQGIGDLTLQEAFTRAGVAHFLALSGQHVAILVAVLEVLLRRFGRARHVFLMVFLMAYLALVGTEPSILRAVLQGMVVLLALALGRGKLDMLGTLALTALVSLTFYPKWLFDVGFQLSYLAVLGLLFTPDLVSKIPEQVPRWLVYPLAATFCAEITTLPVVASQFNVLPWISPLSNLVLGPFMVILVPAGMLAGLLGPLGVLVNGVIGIVLTVFLWLISLFAQVPPLPWGNIGVAGLLVYLVWLVGVGLWLLNRLKPAHLLALTLTGMGITGLPPLLFPEQRIVYLDVGQGDSTLLQLGHFNVLIDGGGSPGSDFDVGAKTVVPALRKLGVFRLDVVVATHADTDHIEGLTSVIQQIPVGELWVGHLKTSDPVMQEVLQAAQDRDIPIRQVHRGNTLEVGQSVLQVLYPQPGHVSPEDNANSVALKLHKGKFSALFLGDLPSSVEDVLAPGPVTVLKVAHHGSRHSTSQDFVRQLQPEHAIISSGKNHYGHPHPDVLVRLQDVKARVWRTDQLGAVMLYLP